MNDLPEIHTEEDLVIAKPARNTSGTRGRIPKPDLFVRRTYEIVCSKCGLYKNKFKCTDGVCQDCKEL